MHKYVVQCPISDLNIHVEHSLHVRVVVCVCAGAELKSAVSFCLWVCTYGVIRQHDRPWQMDDAACMNPSPLCWMLVTFCGDGFVDVQKCIVW